MSAAKFVVGQKLWLVPFYANSYLGNPKEVEIIKVGRVWLTMENRYRVHIDTLAIDSGNGESPGQCYLSKEIWEGEKVLQSAWGRFLMDIPAVWRIPKGMTVERIQEARELLGIKKKGGSA